MSDRLSLAEVDRLIDLLDLAEPNQANWRSSFDALKRGFIRAHRVQEAMRHTLAILLLGMAVFLVVRLYSVGWDYSQIHITFLVCLLTYHALSAFGQGGVLALFPVLKRRERVVSLLRYFGADIPADGADRHMPPDVLVAIETLEKAKSPTDLGRAYASVEAWCASVRRWSLDGFYLAFVWTSAFAVAVLGESFGVQDFWRGAAFMFALMIALQRWDRMLRGNAIERRAEDAIGRWRHLAPAMRETSGQHA